MIAPIWQVALLCAGFFVAGFLTCTVLVVCLRERLVQQHMDRVERDMYGPFLAVQPPAHQPRHAARDDDQTRLLPPTPTPTVDSPTRAYVDVWGQR